MDHSAWDSHLETIVLTKKYADTSKILWPFYKANVALNYLRYLYVDKIQKIPQS